MIDRCSSHLYSMYDLERSEFLCYFIYYNALLSAKSLANIFITKKEGPNIPLLGNEKSCSRIFVILMSRNGDILSKCAVNDLIVS